MAIKSSDQITIVDVTDGYSVMLTNQIHAFIGEIGETCTTEVVAFCGPKQFNQITINQSDITCPANINALVENNGTSKVKVTFTTTGIISSQSEAIIPIVVDGITIEKRFSFAIIRNEQSVIDGKTLDLIWINDGSNFNNTDSYSENQNVSVSKEYDVFVVLFNSGAVCSIRNSNMSRITTTHVLNINSNTYVLVWAKRTFYISETTDGNILTFEPCYYRAIEAGSSYHLANSTCIPIRIYGIKK